MAILIFSREHIRPAYAYLKKTYTHAGQIHRFPNAPIPYPTIQNRNVHISVLNGALWDMRQMHCGIGEIGVWRIHRLVVYSVPIHYLNQCWLTDNWIRRNKRSWNGNQKIKFSPKEMFFSCDQAALWMVFSVRLSVCLSVCPSVRLSHLFDYVPIIVSSWNFQELSHWTRVRSMQKVKVRGQRSRSQRSRPKFSFPDCNSSLNSHMMMKWYI